jgi:hypothetical protein
MSDTPLSPLDEFANSATHAVGLILSIILTFKLVERFRPRSKLERQAIQKVQFFEPLVATAREIPNGPHSMGLIRVHRQFAHNWPNVLGSMASIVHTWFAAARSGPSRRYGETLPNLFSVE